MGTSEFWVGYIVFGCVVILVGFIIKLSKERKMEKSVHKFLDEPINDKKTSYTEEIKELKVLLDEGAISQEEFDAKKKDLLGL